MSTPCPKCGHGSTTADYCDACGALLDSIAAPGTLAPPVAPTPSAPTPAGTGRACPRCGEMADPGAGFCESCGCDVATGAMPESATLLPGQASGQLTTPPAAAGPAVAWDLEIAVDPDGWQRHHDLRPADTPRPQPVTRALTTSTVDVGRRSRSRGTTPDVDAAELTGDPAISHRHCTLVRGVDDSWLLRDDGSENGTDLNGAAVTGTLALRDGDVIRIGAWTTLRLLTRRP